MNPTKLKLYDAHADAALVCVEATEKLATLKAELDIAEQELFAANAKYAVAHERLTNETLRGN